MARTVARDVPVVESTGAPTPVQPRQAENFADRSMSSQFAVRLQSDALRRHHGRAFPRQASSLSVVMWGPGSPRGCRPGEDLESFSKRSGYTIYDGQLIADDVEGGSLDGFMSVRGSETLRALDCGDG